MPPTQPVSSTAPLVCRHWPSQKWVWHSHSRCTCHLSVSPQLGLAVCFRRPAHRSSTWASWLWSWGGIGLCQWGLGSQPYLRGTWSRSFHLRALDSGGSGTQAVSQGWRSCPLPAFSRSYPSNWQNLVSLSLRVFGFPRHGLWLFAAKFKSHWHIHCFVYKTSRFQP